MSNAIKQSGAFLEIVSFHLGEQEFCIDIMAIREIRGWAPVTPMPHTPPYVLGLINLRGQIVITIDLRERMGLPARDEGLEATNVVVRTSGDTVTSLLVDKIGDVLEPDQDRFEAPPDTVVGRVRELVTRVCKLDRELMLVLDTDKAVDVDAAARSF